MTRQYIASRIGRTPRGRIIWRLCSVSGRGTLGKVCDLGDYTGIPGKSGLRMIRDSFRGRPVRICRIVRDQVIFTVSR